MDKKSFIERLKEKWQLKSALQVIIVLVVFSCTGITVMLLKGPVLRVLGVEAQDSWIYSLLYYIFVIPLYQIVLLLYAFIFGQFSFFWNYEKKFFKRIGKVFTKKKAS